jgi:hypothetical protein
VLWADSDEESDASKATFGNWEIEFACVVSGCHRVFAWRRVSDLSISNVTEREYVLDSVCFDSIS